MKLHLIFFLCCLFLPSSWSEERIDDLTICGRALSVQQYLFFLSADNERGFQTLQIKRGSNCHRDTVEIASSINKTVIDEKTGALIQSFDGRLFEDLLKNPDKYVDFSQLNEEARKLERKKILEYVLEIKFEERAGLKATGVTIDWATGNYTFKKGTITILANRISDGIPHDDELATLQITQCGDHYRVISYTAKVDFAVELPKNPNEGAVPIKIENNLGSELLDRTNMTAEEIIKNYDISVYPDFWYMHANADLFSIDEPDFSREIHLTRKISLQKKKDATDKVRPQRIFLYNDVATAKMVICFMSSPE